MPTLTKQHYAKIRKMQDRMSAVRETLQRMRNCGLDCTENEELANRLQSHIDAIEREFFSNGEPI